MSSAPVRVTREQHFLSVLPDIERVIGWVCARRGLRGADAQDFASAVKCRLIENDYDVLARFEGRCSLTTFLTIVISRFYVDLQVRRFGKWRNSAEARRLGPVAMRLERLIHRDHLTFDEACGVLGSDPGVKESREALHEISRRLPHRHPLRQDAAPTLAEASLPGPSDVERGERQELADRTSAVIRSVIARLPARERLVLRLHLVEGLTVAEISRSLGVDPKALYRRKEQLFKRLRAELEAAGIGSAHARELLTAADWEAEFFDDVPENDTGSEQIGSCPSSPWTDGVRREGEA